MKYLLPILFLLLNLGLLAQDDDFFLRSEEVDTSGAILESTQFGADDGGYFDDIVKKTFLQESRVIDYEPLREIDVLWEKRVWRLIDVREKMNQPFKNEDRPFFKILQDFANNGDIKVFADETFKEPLTVDNLSALVNKTDTTVVYDPETYEEKIVITENPIDASIITRYRVKEVWYFDKESSVVKVRILGIAPILDEIDDASGELKYSRPLFWVYYPKIRNILARERVPNDFNDTSPMSWYDLFENRFFASFIIKSSNSLGMRIKDMFPDNDYDQLLEAEAIKAELFNWEHDLWTY